MFCNPVKLMLCYKLNTLPVHHRHTAMNLYQIIPPHLAAQIPEALQGHEVMLPHGCSIQQAQLYMHTVPS